MFWILATVIFVTISHCSFCSSLVAQRSIIHSQVCSPPVFLVKYLQRTLDQSLIFLLVYCCVLRGFHIFQIVIKYPVYLFHQSGSFHSFLWHGFQDKIEICLLICFHALMPICQSQMRPIFCRLLLFCLAGIYSFACTFVSETHFELIF